MITAGEPTRKTQGALAVQWFDGLRHVHNLSRKPLLSLNSRRSADPKNGLGEL